MSGVLEVRGARVRAGATDILAGVDLEVWPGTAVGLVGPNGAGKTTLLDAVSGLVPLSAGDVLLGGTVISDLPPHKRARLGLGRTFQALELFDDLAVRENLQVPADASGGEPPPPQDGDQRLPATLAHDERKALALRRALAGGATRTLLLDEPAAGLDRRARHALLARLRSLVDAGLGILIADHDLELVLGLCDRVYVLDFGRVIAIGPPAAIRADPRVAAAYLGHEAAGPTTPRPEPTPAPGNTLLDARAVTAGYGTAPVLHGVDVTVAEGEVVALLGPNGAGKTTTLLALSGALPVTRGAVTALGVRVHGRPSSTARLARRGLAHVPQGRAVLPSLTVAENLRLAARAGSAAANPGSPGTPASPGSRRSRRAAGQARRAAVDDVLAEVRALAPLLDRRAGRLSGGEQQILALARAMAARPRLLLVDELSLGLAPRPARHAVETVRRMADAGTGVLLVEQHPGLALEVADRALVLARGRVVFDGTSAELAARPEVLDAAYLGETGSPPRRE